MIKSIQRSLLFSILVFAVCTMVQGQAIKNNNSGAILLDMKKLSVLGNVLYFAAHPDDENTNLISYLSYDALVNTGYMSLTRGDGGQNLIGKEIRTSLGLIRTNELLAARAIDGGAQFFSRANDFGYSKTSEETLEIWDKQKVLYDAVKVIRKFRPDVIITRFPPDSRAGHGHHTASAMIAIEVFDLAADPTVFPDQLETLDTWQVKRLFINTGRWWEQDMSVKSMYNVDIGGYNSLLGASYTEISAKSRSQHKSQGFGVSGSRGSRIEYLNLVKGNGSNKKDAPFAGLDFTWDRVQGGQQIKTQVAALVRSFDSENPSKSIPALFKIRKEISALEDEFWRNKKTKEVDQLIQRCLGLFLEVNSDAATYVQGDSIAFSMEFTNRTAANIKLKSVLLTGAVEESLEKATLLENNRPLKINHKSVIKTNAEITQPYWLAEKWSYGMYHVSDKTLLGKPMNDPAIQAKVSLEIEGQNLSYTIPVDFKFNDRVKGECHKPIVVAPPFTINTEVESLIFSTTDSRKVALKIKANTDINNMKIAIAPQKGWGFEFNENPISLVKGAESYIDLKITPPRSGAELTLPIVGMLGKAEYGKATKEMEYDHLPYLTWFPDASIRLVKLDIKISPKRIGYFMGAGDKVPEALTNIGYEVTMLTEADFKKQVLEELDVVIFGIRAFNTAPRIELYKALFMEYVENGGKVIVQYNTRDIKVNDFFPYAINVSRDRVADENAVVTILEPKHAVFNTPNAITQKDFENWVQERGLYFPDQWDDNFMPLLAMNDKGESPKKGSLLVAKYGKGYYIHSGISWFRELPAGVSGAYRLFVNILSL